VAGRITDLKKDAMAKSAADLLGSYASVTDPPVVVNSHTSRFPMTLVPKELVSGFGACGVFFLLFPSACRRSRRQRTPAGRQTARGCGRRLR
jgi:hypothetical protein